MPAYYNDNDKGVAATLRELIRQGLIPDGEVDERSILDVSADELRGFTQCHFFAGIGGWAYALRLAGWPDDRPVWTGSPPCQPFSVAGKQLGRDDPRHLAPKFAGLVRAARPAMLFGEQVASAEVFGKSAKPPKRRGGTASATAPEWGWLDDLQNRLEAACYRFGALDLSAAVVGAPNIRQRTFFGAVRMADTEGGWEWGSQLKADEDAGEYRAGSGAGRLADSIGAGLEGQPWHGRDGDQSGRDAAQQAGSVAASCGIGDLADTRRPDAPNGPWGVADWLRCRDEPIRKWRPVRPGTFPLAYGVSARVGRLRGYGNAINPWVAKAFIEAFCRAEGVTL